MSARCWAARKGDPEVRAKRVSALHCKFISPAGVGCLLNRRRHVVHLCPPSPPSWAYGTNRMGRRKARRLGLTR